MKKHSFPKFIPNYHTFTPPILQIDLVRFPSELAESELKNIINLDDLIESDYVYNAVVTFYLEVRYANDEKTEFFPEYVTTIVTGIWNTCHECAIVKTVEYISSLFDAMILRDINIFDGKTHDLIERVSYNDIAEKRGIIDPDDGEPENNDEKEDLSTTFEEITGANPDTEIVGITEEGKFVYKMPKTLH